MDHRCGKASKTKVAPFVPHDVFGAQHGVFFERFGVFEQDGFKVFAVRAPVGKEFGYFDFVFLQRGNFGFHNFVIRAFGGGGGRQGGCQG